MEREINIKNLKKITILHSNDLHGDFTSEKIDDRLIGGVSMLSGYIQKVRAEEENVIYTISGDMFRGSLIDSEYKGLSTIEIMNMIGPNVVTVGNHEVDYGISHLLFLEKCAHFPIINANIYITMNSSRLFKSHTVLNVGGVKVLFIGILTKDVIAQTKRENLIGPIIDVRDAKKEIGRVCDAYKTEDIDLTVLLTHIGFEEDKKLAFDLDPRWGIDIIIGGHSHTLLEKPCVVNGIPIVQAAYGTNQLGRFDIVVDTSNSSIESYTWELIPIDENHCPEDGNIKALVNKFKNETDRKFNRCITRLQRRLTHGERNRESELGRLFADALAESLGLDIMLVASGSLRGEALGPVVEYKDLMEMCPFNAEVYRIAITGAQLKRALNYIFRAENTNGSHAEFYQFSRGIRFVFSASSNQISELTFNGEPISDDRIFKVGLQAFHFENIEDFLGLTKQEVSVKKSPKVIATRETDVIEEYFMGKPYIECPSDQRWITVE